MAKTLSVNYPSPPINKLEFSRFDFDEDTQTLTYNVTLKTGVATDANVCRVTMVIKDGLSTTLARNATPAVGLNYADAERYFVHNAAHELPTRSTPTGFTDALATRNASYANAAARKAALEDLQWSAGHIDTVSLAKT